MGIRHLARQRALQLLYALEFSAPEETFERVERRYLHVDSRHRRGWGPFGRKLVLAVRARPEELDSTIAPMLHKWTLDRIPLVDRLCLRMALVELRYFDDIPLRVTINEYIELARMFGTDESPVYINAILDRLAREFPQKDFQAMREEPDQPDAPVSPELDQMLREQEDPSPGPERPAEND